MPATIVLPPSLASILAVKTNLLVSFPVLGSLTTKHFMLLRMVARITSPGIARYSLLERAHHHDRPFDEASDLVEQRLVLDQIETLRERELLGVSQDHVLAALGVEHDLGREQLLFIVFEAAHAKSARAP